jgi:hypothetical protein
MRFLVFLTLLALSGCQAPGPSTDDIRKAVTAFYDVPHGAEAWPSSGPADLRDAKIVRSGACVSAGRLYFCDAIFERADGSRATISVNLTAYPGAIGWRVSAITPGHSPGAGD